MSDQKISQLEAGEKKHREQTQRSQSLMKIIRQVVSSYLFVFANVQLHLSGSDKL